MGVRPVVGRLQVAVRPFSIEEYEQKRFANTKLTAQQQSILLPSPLGEGLGVRLVEGRARPIVGWELAANG